MSVLTLTKDTFDNEAMNIRATVLIDFWADWCGPCRMISPVIDEIAELGLENVKVCKVNVDTEPELAAKFGVMTIPTLIVIRNGKKIASSVGVKPKQEIIKMLI